MKRLLLLLVLLLLPLSALAQPAPTYQWITILPQSGTPGTAVNGTCWTQSTGLFCQYGGTPHGPFITAGGASLVIGSTPITGGSAGQVLYDNSGALGEYTATSLTAQINVFSSSLSGAAPASGGGTTNYLRADGTWAPPPGATSGTVTSVGVSTPSSTLSVGGTNPVTGAGTISIDINLSHANTWAAKQSFGSGDLALNGATSGSITVNAAATAGSNTITLPAGTTDFSATGGTSQVIKQTSVGGAFTVAQLACGDLSNAGSACQVATGTSGATVPLLNAANVWSNQQSASITTLAIATSTFTPDGTNNNYKITLVHASCPCTLANPSATPVAGTSGVIQVIQSATGSDTIGTWGSDYEAPGGTSAIVLSTGANAVDTLAYFVVDSTHILLVPSLNFSH